ncbi:linoleoyl-CoA desaturase [Aquabacterium commune]|uniref:Linoleoyl-CoA desaturase n=1 Tax=Aquabacterium commune TaxID=70586 RepID=A0A4R6RJB8_9BURK|nr:acyl-CoA desaturase [Aquabacterium commune]TDP85957.1 linoleoyl-CoA desaturase [Aquabacterium commune]
MSTPLSPTVDRTVHIGPKNAAEMLAFERELDAIRDDTRRTVGERDARYIRRIQRLVRVTETLGRALLLFGWFPPTWLLGAALLGLSKIIDNMELGHNVMHGQFNFMNDPQFHGDTFDWDNTCPKEEWRHSHNFVHHTYTNVIGKDRDFGYGLLRLSSDLRWSWLHPFQLLLTLLLASFFQWFVAIHDMQMDKVVIGRKKWSEVRPQWLLVRAKMWRIVKRDYIVWPLVGAVVAAPFGQSQDVALAVLAGNVVGNFIRNIWAWAIIFCGHFTEHIYTFSRASIEGESKGQWYLRQILGSSNISGGSVLHLMSGNLSHQVEHHLFPDIPGNRYVEMAPRVRAVCAKYNVPYNTGSFALQLWTVVKRIARYSLPGGGQKAVHIEVPSVLPEQV